eukprot:TRINITY_DN65970_c0_g2_i4.p1 TRINITY_DN65970_c0_g2~~TRINITY_DN65970_c0_g2_i4.p1  ORF type:complete len:482 (+),score=31.02 TRINITY_DN65970_c0_g2_i4:53-1498(+)
MEAIGPAFFGPYRVTWASFTGDLKSLSVVHRTNPTLLRAKTVVFCTIPSASANAVICAAYGGQWETLVYLLTDALCAPGTPSRNPAAALEISSAEVDVNLSEPEKFVTITNCKGMHLADIQTAFQEFFELPTMEDVWFEPLSTTDQNGVPALSYNVHFHGPRVAEHYDRVGQRIESIAPTTCYLRVLEPKKSEDEQNGEVLEPKRDGQHEVDEQHAASTRLRETFPEEEETSEYEQQEEVLEPKREGESEGEQHEKRLKRWVRRKRKRRTRKMEVVLPQVWPVKAEWLLHSTDSDGNTAFHHCAAQCHLDCLKWLHSQGWSDFVTTNIEGHTAFQAAAGSHIQDKARQVETLEWMLSVGAQPSPGCAAPPSSLNLDQWCILGAEGQQIGTDMETAEQMMDNPAARAMQQLNDERTRALVCAAASNNMDAVVFLVSQQQEMGDTPPAGKLDKFAVWLAQRFEREETASSHSVWVRFKQLFKR